MSAQARWDTRRREMERRRRLSIKATVLLFAGVPLLIGGFIMFAVTYPIVVLYAWPALAVLIAVAYADMAWDVHRSRLRNMPVDDEPPDGVARFPDRTPDDL